MASGAAPIITVILCATAVIVLGCIGLLHDLARAAQLQLRNERDGDLPDLAIILPADDEQPD